MKLLALDVGDRRVGVAVSDEGALIATPLTVIRRSSKVETKSASPIPSPGAAKTEAGPRHGSLDTRLRWL